MHDNTLSPGPSVPQGKLLEGIVTTLGEDGSPHIAPMGPIVDANFERLLLRPFSTSVTHRNLKRTREGVLHVTDDVELIARAAVDRLETLPPLVRAEVVDGVILTGACRWYAFAVESLDDRQERTAIIARIVGAGRLRDFFGFNRAKHAVIEAAILATRIELLDAKMILAEFERLAAPVTKTGGTQECRAFEFLRQYVDEKLQAAAHPSPLEAGKGEGVSVAPARPHPDPRSPRRIFDPEGEGDSRETRQQ
jgi:hypothetical protein